MGGQRGDTGDVIEAAGGVLWRDADGAVEYALIHRARYDDWSLPKGKLDEGEDHLRAAVREVHEETGHVVEVGEPLGEISYENRGRHKRVLYWGMRAREGAFAANREVDELRWLPYGAARAMLTYDRDRSVLDRFVQVHGQAAGR